MAKASITQKMSLNANGILAIMDGEIGIENLDTGEFILLDKLLADFVDKSVKLSITYDFDYETIEEHEA